MYFVKISAKFPHMTIVEMAGKCGARTGFAILLADGSVAKKPNGKPYAKPRKIEGWKTIKSAEKYIETEMERDELRYGIKDKYEGRTYTKEYEIVEA